MTQRTRSGPRRTKFSPFVATTKAKYTHSTKIIALSDVTTRFDDACVRKLAQIAKLPPEADLQDFGWWIRGAADMFAREALVPTSNEVRNEIASLHDAAERRDFEKLIRLSRVLSLEARTILGKDLPAATDLEDGALRDEAAAALASRCRISGQRVEGRRRPDGTRSPPSIRPDFNAPEASRTFLKRKAERNFVERISIAWHKATDKEPPRTARRGRAERDIGPFARFVGECLRLVGASYADPVALINELGASRGRGDNDLSRINP
jgi:hypothetical protein